MHIDSTGNHSRRRRLTLTTLFAVLLAPTMAYTAPPAGASEDGFSQVRNRQDQLCLDTRGAFHASAPVGADYCEDALGQQWKLNRLESGWYQIKVRNTNMCLNVGYASTRNGEQVVQYPCVSDPNDPWQIYGANEQWRLHHVAGEYYQIIARHSGKCLDKSHWNVVQYQCHDGYWQQWKGLNP